MEMTSAVWSLITVLALVSTVSTVVAVVYMCFMSSERSGWQQLAEHFRQQDPFRQRRLHLASAVLNGFAFHGTLTLGVDETGLFMVPELPIRPFHPPLYLRWEQLASRPFARTHSSGLELSLINRSSEVPEFSLEIEDGLGVRLLALCEPEWDAAAEALTAPQSEALGVR